MAPNYDGQILLIKAARGNRVLGSEFRLAASRGTSCGNHWSFLAYRLAIGSVHKMLS